MLIFMKKQTGTTQKSLDNRGQIVKVRKNKPRDLNLSTVIFNQVRLQENTKEC